MASPSHLLEVLIKEFSKLPGIGSKSASRLAFHFVKMNKNEAKSFANAILALKENITSCSNCGGISDSQLCAICEDNTRDNSIICVVEEARDVFTLEKTGEYNGVYHVLHGLISPLDGVGPDDLNIAQLLKRCQSENIKEIIIALGSRVEGDATSLYLAKLLNPTGIKITRLAHGLPVGSELDFADSATIIKSLEGRIEIV